MWPLFFGFGCGGLDEEWAQFPVKIVLHTENKSREVVYIRCSSKWKRLYKNKACALTSSTHWPD